MKKYILICLVPMLALLMTACGERSLVKKDLAAKAAAIGDGMDMEQVLSGCADRQEREAMKFLYAYMPVGDVADYSPQLYLDGVRTVFRAREEMPWGREVPEELFRHFVLPLRVNNETLDEFRTECYEDLSGRVRNLSMHDAVLEVNHWCHERVTYTPSDARTSSPLASIRTGYGRCGEESVLLVAALRTVGIPARQVYTPRWAHTDDNHAWVEAWVDGHWHYLGACEPEPELDVAWFSSTALRGVMMHTNVFGRYEGPEDVISRTDCYTEINVTSNYAPVERVTVTVTDAAGVPVEGARVEYKIYNYSEFYTAVTDISDRNGLSHATFGRGDILVWASSGGRFGYGRLALSEGETSLTLVLDKDSSFRGYEEIDIVPPAEGKAVVELTPEDVQANAVRLAREDSLRVAYIAGFNTSDPYLAKARGNWREIAAYMEASRSYGRDALHMLDLLSEKDLRDTPSGVLTDHISHFAYNGDDPVLRDYVLNPRVGLELLSPYRSVFLKAAADGVFGPSGAAGSSDSSGAAVSSGSDNVCVEALIDYASGIRLCDRYNPLVIPVTPVGVFRLGAADSYSRDVFFVALCRTFGIPARLEEVSGKLQYHDGERWVDVDLSGGSAAAVAEQGTVTVDYAGQEYIDDPKYETHFTIARIDGGSPVTLNFTDKEGREGSMTWKTVFGDGPVTLDCGQYMMVSGTRMASGKVLATMTFFSVTTGENTDVTLVMREDPSDLQVIGSMNAEALYLAVQPEADGELRESTILATTGRGFFVLGFMQPRHEPSNHAVRGVFADVPECPVILMYGSEREYRQYLSDGFPSAPAGVHFGVDRDWAVLGAVCRELKLSLRDVEYPVFVIADTFGRIVYISQGYNIGTAEQIARLVRGI